MTTYPTMKFRIQEGLGLWMVLERCMRRPFSNRTPICRFYQKMQRMSWYIKRKKISGSCNQMEKCWIGLDRFFKNFLHFRYKTGDFRITLVYRSRCFATEEKRQSFRDWHKSGKNVRPVEVVLDELKAELVSRFGYSKEALDTMPKLQLANVLTNEFLNYPSPINAIVPFNYCSLPAIMPWTNIFFKLIC